MHSARKKSDGHIRVCWQERQKLFSDFLILPGCNQGSYRSLHGRCEPAITGQAFNAWSAQHIKIAMDSLTQNTSAPFPLKQKTYVAPSSSRARPLGGVQLHIHIVECDDVAPHDCNRSSTRGGTLRVDARLMLFYRMFESAKIYKTFLYKTSAPISISKS